jgi:hypothetical protein
LCRGGFVWVVRFLCHDLVGHCRDERCQHERKEAHANHEHEDAPSGAHAMHSKFPRWNERPTGRQDTKFLKFLIRSFGGISQLALVLAGACMNAGRADNQSEMGFRFFPILLGTGPGSLDCLAGERRAGLWLGCYIIHLSGVNPGLFPTVKPALKASTPVQERPSDERTVDAGQDI